MIIIKELHLVARVAYSLVAAFMFWLLSGFSLESCLITAGITTFPMSFLFQYYVLDFAMRSFTVHRQRVIILLVWGVVTGASVGLAMAMVPSLDDLRNYADVKLFEHDFYLWATIYYVSCAAFVAFTCTRRAWDRHGQLG